MRNLRNIRYNTWSSSLEFPEERKITATCWDPAKDEILSTFGPSEDDARIELVRISEHVRATSVETRYQKVASWEAPSPTPDIPADRVVNLHHFSDSLTTCIVLAGGDIVIVQEDETSSSPRDGGVHIEIVGSIDAGITAALWSPDEELLAITTSENTVVFMSRGFEGIADVTMTVDDLNASRHVSVGWGKKETQFQGKGAKALRDPTIPEKVDEGVLSPNDDGRVTISWRGDGAYVAINSIEAAAPRRVIRVYTRDGALDSVSEPVDGMESALSWRPSGNLLASIQRFEDRVDVIFFERNGLRHGHFSLRAPKGHNLVEDRISLQWNSDSTVLGAMLSDRVQLWTMGNYHWYLKQEIRTTTAPFNVAWHPEKSLRLAIALPNEMVLAEYIFTISRGSVAPPNDHGAVAVIDGQILKITPFRTANVPPPMSMFDLSTTSAIADVYFSANNAFLIILHQLGLDLYAWNTRNGRSLAPSLIGSLLFLEKSMSRNLIPLEITFHADNGIQVLCFDKKPILHGFTFDPSSGTIEAERTSEAGSLSSLQSFGDYDSVKGSAQDAFGKLHIIGSTRTEPLALKSSLYLPWNEIVCIDGGVLSIGLSRNGQLYANGNVLAKNCTSFLVTPAHLIFTTTNHLLKFVHLTSIDDLEIPLDDPETDERCRTVERGARLVTAIPSNMSVVLQMPRGNLETIYPRAMVVAGIRQLIDEKNYARAFSYCRTQRVDMNILYDHQPKLFLDNVDLFISQLTDVSYIDLFLSSLREEDVSQTMYKNTKQPRQLTGFAANPTTNTHDVSQLSEQQSKVNTICDAVLKGLQSRKDSNLQNIITANVCRSPPALEDGLLVVAKLMQEDEALAEKAVEHICFLADVNILYDHALGLYNLDLALLVAQQSQRDPREYLPFIQNLHLQPELRRRFTIDDHLGRHEKAISHLQELNAFGEVQKYTVKHALYPTALKLYRYNKAELRVITTLYAEHLESRSRFREAGLAYEALQLYPNATQCYRAAGVSCWRECLFTALQQSPPLSGEALSELATALSDALYEAKDYGAAATIHFEYLASLESAVRYFCKGYLFADALRLVALRNRPDLLATAIDTGLADALGNSTEFLADCKAQLRAQVPRILELRRKAAEDPLAFYEGERAGGADIPDDISVAASSRISTSASLFTRYTGKAGSVGTLGSNVSRATSKNRRREEKKRARGRKGTVYEEEYLVNSVRRLAERVENTKGEIERLVFGLVRRDMGERARAVETLMGEVIEGCKEAVVVVFGKREDEEAARQQQEGNGEEGWTPMGADAVLHENLQGGWKKADAPVITAFERLSLLGS